MAKRVALILLSFAVVAFAYASWRTSRLSSFLEEVNQIMVSQEMRKEQPTVRIPERVRRAIKEIKEGNGDVQDWKIQQVGADLACEVLHVEMIVTRGRGVFREQIIGMPDIVSYDQY